MTDEIATVVDFLSQMPVDGKERSTVEAGRGIGSPIEPELKFPRLADLGMECPACFGVKPQCLGQVDRMAQYERVA